MTDFPITIKMAPKYLEEFACCEEGLWEDMDRDENKRTCDDTMPAFPVIVRYADRIEIRNRDEAEAIMWAAESGTFKLHHPYVCDRLIEQLRAHGVDYKFHVPKI